MELAWYWDYTDQTVKYMFVKFFFNRMSLQKQVSYLKKKGIMLGTRIKDGRKVYIYMLQDLFLEVIYIHDNTDNDAEHLTSLRGLDNLNEHLEKEFKATF